MHVGTDPTGETYHEIMELPEGLHYKSIALTLDAFGLFGDHWIGLFWAQATSGLWDIVYSNNSGEALIIDLYADLILQIKEKSNLSDEELVAIDELWEVIKGKYRA